VGVERGIIKKSGAFLSFGDVRLGQGRENARQFLRDNADVRAQIETAIRATGPAAATRLDPEAIEAAAA
jgi:recombination protein RecA